MEGIEYIFAMILRLAVFVNWYYSVTTTAVWNPVNVYSVDERNFNNLFRYWIHVTNYQVFINHSCTNPFICSELWLCYRPSNKTTIQTYNHEQVSVRDLSIHNISVGVRCIMQIALNLQILYMYSVISIRYKNALLSNRKPTKCKSFW